MKILLSILLFCAVNIGGAQQTITNVVIGTANDGTGDTVRAAFSKINTNFALLNDLAELGNVKRFRAVADYDFDEDTGTDNQAAFSNAVMRAIALEQGNRPRLVIPSGTYKLDYLNLYDESDSTNTDKTRYWTIEGSGDGNTVLYFNHASSNAITVLGGGVRIKNLWIDATPARRAAKGTYTGFGGHGVWIRDVNESSTIAPYHFENLHIQNQPGHGMYLWATELINAEGILSQANGGAGFWIAGDSAAFHTVFVNTWVNCRAYLNAEEGWHVEGVYQTFINCEGLSNGGRAQFIAPDATATRNLFLINCDFENQLHNGGITNAASTAISFEGSVITNAAATWATAGISTNHSLLITGSSTNDGIYTIADVSETAITITGEFTTEAAGASIIVAASSNNWGMILNGLGHKVEGGHFSGLNGGIYLEDADDCVIANPTIGNFSSNFQMVDQILVSSNSSYNTVTMPKSSSYWTSLGGVRDLNGTTTISHSAMSRYAGPWPVSYKHSTATGSITPTAGAFLFDMPNAFFVLSDVATDAAQKAARWGIRAYNITNLPFAGLVFLTTSSSSAVNIGGGTAAGNAATHNRFWAAASNTTPTGTLIGQITTEGLLIDTAGIGLSTNRATAPLDVRGDAVITGEITFGAGGAKLITGTGDPNFSVSAPIGSIYLRLDASTDGFFVKTNGVGNTDWSAR